MVTRGKGKASKTTEKISDVSEAMIELTLGEREQKAQKEIEKMEAEIRVESVIRKESTYDIQIIIFVSTHSIHLFHRACMVSRYN